MIKEAKTPLAKIAVEKQPKNEIPTDRKADALELKLNTESKKIQNAAFQQAKNLREEANSNADNVENKAEEEANKILEAAKTSKMTQEYIESNKSKFLDELMELLTIPSVSADLSFKDDVLKAATFLCDQLTQIGADNVQLFPTAGHPIVYGEKIISNDAPTVLVYGHVMFNPQILMSYGIQNHLNQNKKTKYTQMGLSLQGACDDKGQMFMHPKAFEAMYKTNNLNCNVKFMLEGEEEVGSENLEKFVREHKDMLEADVVLVSDTGIINNQTPSICVGLRGLSYLEVEVTGPNRDLHSGLHGGGVANPINILSSMIASCMMNQK